MLQRSTPAGALTPRQLKGLLRVGPDGKRKRDRRTTSNTQNLIRLEKGRHAQKASRQRRPNRQNSKTRNKLVVYESNEKVAKIPRANLAKGTEWNRCKYTGNMAQVTYIADQFTNKEHWSRQDF